jgi:hypothetical protein
MRPDLVDHLTAIARGEVDSVPGGTDGTCGTAPFLTLMPHGTPVGTKETSRDQKSPSFQVFQMFQMEHDEIAEAERAAIAVFDGRVPTAYADAWAAFQVRKPGNVSTRDWNRAVDDAGRFLDAWARLALDFGWQPPDIFGSRGLAWFCAGEWIRAVGPNNAVTESGRIFTRRASQPAEALIRSKNNQRKSDGTRR